MRGQKFQILDNSEVERLAPGARKVYFNGLTDFARSLEEVVYRDVLTGLYNRRYFDETLKTEVGRSERDHDPVSLVMSDVDFFKQFNERYGYIFADFVLNRVGHALQGRVQRDADKVCRLGGEEYGIILPSTPLDGAVVLAEDARKRVKQMNMGEELERACISGTEAETQRASHILKKIKRTTRDRPDRSKVTMSFGVGAYPHKGITTDLGFYDTTNDALKLAKESGRNRVKSFSDLKTI